MNATTQPLHRAILFLAAAFSLLLTSCGAESPASTAPPPSTDGVVIVTNSRANVPAPRLSPANVALLTQALGSGLPVTIVSADGTPQLVDLPIPRVSGNNEHSLAKNLERALQVVGMGITALPDSDGANAYSALAVARDSAIALGLTDPTIICLACGLDTEGPLSLDEGGALQADPQDFVAYLESSGQLIRFGDAFASVTVVLTSTGATAPPQTALRASEIEHLTAIWREVLLAGGAEVAVDPQPLSGEPIASQFVVPVVTPPPAPTMQPIAACEPQTLSFDGASGARFEPKTDVWTDLDAATAALAPLAYWLKESSDRTARIAGTTADVLSGDPNEGKDLSRLRATAAARLLVELGVAEHQIVGIDGLGPDYPGRVPDRDAAGNPIPSERTKNRKVLITLQQTC